MKSLVRAFLLACLSILPVSAQAVELPETMPVPKPRPAMEKAGLPAEELACRARLRQLGVVFTETAPVDEPEGCTAAHPLAVSVLPGGVALRPDAVLTCAMAEATALFVRDHARSATKKRLGAALAAVDQVSSYVCRKRNGATKLSEHAFANALDWGALELEDGTRIEIRAYGADEPRRKRLLADLREAACGPFTTVLGPGSDADHADHFHFDLAERRNDATFCQ